MSMIWIVLGVMAFTVLLVLAVSVATAYYILKDPMLQDPKRGDRL